MTTTNASYKDSGIAWIGQIPEAWKVKRLKYIAHIETGYTPPKADPENYSETWIPRIKPDNLNELEYLIDSSEKISEKWLERNSIIQKDDIMVCCIGSVGKMWVAWCALTFNQQINGVIFNSEVSKWFWKFLILASQEEHLQSSQSVVLPILNKTKQSNISFPLPPLPTQTAIASYLDTKTTQISEFITKKKQLISFLQEQKQAIIHQAVTKGIDLSAKMKDSGIVWIGQIPEGWEVRRLKMLSNIKRWASPRPIDDKKYFDENGEFAWVRISDVTASDMYLLETEQQLSELWASLSVKQYPWDLFLSIAWSVWKPIITKIKCCIHDGFVTFWHISKKVDKMFLYYILASWLAYVWLGKEWTQLNLNIDTVWNITIPLPSIDIQKKLIQYIVDKNTKIDQAIDKIEQEIALIEEYRTSLIYHAVTGKIIVQ